MFKYIHKKIAKLCCKINGHYRGRRGRIQRVGYLDCPMWCVAMYKCSDVSQVVKSFKNLDDAIGGLMRIECNEI
jgi:hypothetical protein